MKFAGYLLPWFVAVRRAIALVGLIGLLALAGFVGFQLYRITQPGASVVTTVPTATVLRQVQAMSELVTVKYVFEKVVILEDVKWYGENRVLLLAHGVIKAGVNFRGMEERDVSVLGRFVRVRIPKAVVTDAYLDETKTRVVERNTGVLRAYDKDLEQMARKQAVEDLKRAARQAGILTDAEERARMQLENLLGNLGFESVQILFE